MPHLHQILVSHLIGGAGIVAIRLAGAAVRRNIPSTAWVPGVGPAYSALEDEHASIRLYDLGAMRGGAPRHLWACARMFPGMAAASRPLVHVHNPTVYRLLRPALAAARARTVVHFQIEPSGDEIRWALHHPPDRVVTCARYIAQKIVRETGQLADGAVVSVPNSIDVTRFAPGSRPEARARAGLPTDRFVALMMANLAPHKGQATAIRAVGLLVKDRTLPVELWLAGEDRAASGEYERELRRLVQELGLADRVRLLGFRPDGPDLLRAADVLLLPSTHEGLPLTILEAQAAGIPVVASTIPGVMEVVEDGKTGFTVHADDSAGYARAIAALYESPSLRVELTAAACDQVNREYSWTSFETRMFEIYRSLSPAIAGRTPSAELAG